MRIKCPNCGCAFHVGRVHGEEKKISEVPPVQGRNLREEFDEMVRRYGTHKVVSMVARKLAEQGRMVQIKSMKGGKR